MRRVSSWIKHLQSGSADEALRGIYGDDEQLLTERKRAYLQLLKAFAAQFGENNEAIISRSPGRLNLMGRHVDHRGGYVNPIALNLEMLIVAQPRSDDQVVVYNVDSSFNPRNFLIHQEIPDKKIRDLSEGSVGEEWDRWTFERFQQRQSQGTARDWDNYIKAAVVYFQDLLREADGSFRKKFSGMNLMVSGNIPHSAGLSSSSALFVATAEAVLALNGLQIPAGEFIEHCGRGEWYVGTRGGSGDHAAMKYGKRGMISHIGFHPSSVEHVPFPADYRVIIANSWDEAHKAGGARSVFNQRVACYEIGFMMIQERFPDLAPKIQRLRDINCRNLGVTEERIYEILLALPDAATRDEIRAALPPEKGKRLEELFAKHEEPEGGYGIRRVCLFGLAECERSRICIDLLNRGEVGEFGQLMQISHDGDRVAKRGPSGEMQDWDASNINPKSDLHRQPGGYACSTPRVDEMVDLVPIQSGTCEPSRVRVDGAIGAQISGAGLGGCIMVLTHRDSVRSVLETLKSGYYEKYHLPPDMHVCSPVEGSGVLPEF